MSFSSWRYDWHIAGGLIFWDRIDTLARSKGMQALIPNIRPRHTSRQFFCIAPFRKQHDPFWTFWINQKRG